MRHRGLCSVDARTRLRAFVDAAGAKAQQGTRSRSRATRWRADSRHLRGTIQQMNGLAERSRPAPPTPHIPRRIVIGLVRKRAAGSPARRFFIVGYPERSSGDGVVVAARRNQWEEAFCFGCSACQFQSFCCSRCFGITDGRLHASGRAAGFRGSAAFLGGSGTARDGTRSSV